MGRVFEYPRGKPGVPCTHPTPVLTTPWWEWSCSRCTPGCWRTFTEPDFRPEHKRPKAVECPLCLWVVRYQDGKMRPHQEDNEDCRCSGMPEPLAHRYVDALIAGKSVSEFVDESLKRRRIVLELKDLKAEPKSIVELLTGLRRDEGWTQGYVAAQLRTSRSTLAEWEIGVNSPLIGSAIRWVDALGRELRLVGDHVDRPVTSQAITAWWLSELRDVSLNKLAAKIGVNPKSLSRWESGRATFRLTDLEDWAGAFRLTVKLEEKGKS